MFPDVIDRVRVRFDRDILITIRSVLIIPVKRMQDQGRLLAPIALFLDEPTPAFRLILIVQRLSLIHILSGVKVTNLNSITDPHFF